MYMCILYIKILEKSFSVKMFFKIYEKFDFMFDEDIFFIIDISPFSIANVRNELPFYGDKIVYNSCHVLSKTNKNNFLR